MKWLGLVGFAIGIFAVLTWVPAMSAGGPSIGLLPPETDLSLFAGETGSYQLKLHNGNGQSVSVSISVVVVQVPLGGLASDLSLSYPSSVRSNPGNSLVTVVVEVSASAVPGVYRLANTAGF